MAKNREQQGELWGLGVLAKHTLGSFDLVVCIVIFGPSSALAVFKSI